MRAIRDGGGLGTVVGVPAEAMQAVAAATEAAGLASAPRSVTTIRPNEPRRVVVALPRPVRGRPELDAVAGALADSLRRHIEAHPRFTVVPPDSVAAVLRESRTINTVQERLQADLIVSISLIPARDSVVRMVQMRDLGAPQGFNYRALTSHVPTADPKQGLSDVASTVVRQLVEMERGRARPRPTREAPRVDVPAPPATPPGTPPTG